MAARGLKGEKMNKEFLDTVPRETLYTFINNDEHIIDSLQERLFKLTGCYDFGNMDGMNGSCIECFHLNRELFDKCEHFKFDKN